MQITNYRWPHAILHKCLFTISSCWDTRNKPQGDNNWQHFLSLQFAVRSLQRWLAIRFQNTAFDVGVPTSSHLYRCVWACVYVCVLNWNLYPLTIAKVAESFNFIFTLRDQYNIWLDQYFISPEFVSWITLTK